MSMSERDFFLDLLSTCLLVTEFSCDATLCTTVNWVTKILMLHTSRNRPHGPQVPYPCFKSSVTNFDALVLKNNALNIEVGENNNFFSCYRAMV